MTVKKIPNRLPCECEYLSQPDDKAAAKKSVIVVDIDMMRYIDHVHVKQQMIFPNMTALKEYLEKCSKDSRRFYYAHKETYSDFWWENNDGCVFEITNIYERKELFGSFLHRDAAGDPTLAYSCDASIKRLINQTGKKRK